MKYGKKYLYYSYFCFLSGILFLLTFGIISIIIENNNEEMIESILLIAIFLIVFMIIGFTIITLSYHKTKYTISDKEITFSKGIIFRKTQIVSFNKISAVNIHKNILMRPFGISKLSIDSLCAYKDAEDEIVIYDDDKKIKEIESLIISKLKNDNLDNANVDTNTGIEYKYTFKDAFTSVICSLFFVLLLVLSIVLLIISIIITKNKTTEFIFYIIGIAIVLVLAFISSVLSRYLRYYGYTITYDEENIRLCYGLFVKKDYVINRKRIKAVAMSEDIVKKAFGYTKVTFEMVGLGNVDSSNDNTEPNDSFMPFVKKETANKIISRVLPEYDFENLTIKAKNKSYKFFILLPFIVISFICLPVIIVLLQTDYLIVGIVIYSILLVIMMLRAKLLKQNQGMYYDNKKICLSTGSFIRKRYTILWENVVCIELHTTILREKYEITSIYINTNGGLTKSTKKVINVDKNELVDIDCKLIKQKIRRFSN